MKVSLKDHSTSTFKKATPLQLLNKTVSLQLLIRLT